MGLLDKIFKKTPQATEGTVLVIDDEESIRELLRMHMETLGYEVIKADCADAAWKILDKGKQIDLFLMDIKMPGDDGVTLAKSLRADQAHAKTPIMFVSGAFPQSELQKICEQYSNTVAVPKPFSAKKLKEALAELKPVPKRRRRTRVTRVKR